MSFFQPSFSCRPRYQAQNEPALFARSSNTREARSMFADNAVSSQASIGAERSQFNCVAEPFAPVAMALVLRSVNLSRARRRCHRHPPLVERRMAEEQQLQQHCGAHLRRGSSQLRALRPLHACYSSSWPWLPAARPPPKRGNYKAALLPMIIPQPRLLLLLERPLAAAPAPTPPGSCSLACPTRPSSTASSPPFLPTASRPPLLRAPARSSPTQQAPGSSPTASDTGTGGIRQSWTAPP